MDNIFKAEHFTHTAAINKRPPSFEVARFVPQMSNSFNFLPAAPSAIANNPLPVKDRQWATFNDARTEQCLAMAASKRSSHPLQRDMLIDVK